MKFLFLLILFFFLLGPVFRFALRTFFYRKVNQFQKQNTQSRPVRREGDIRVDNATPKNKQRTSDSDGQYIDFEEIKD